MHKPTHTEHDAARHVIDLITGGWTTQVLGVTVRLGLADHVAKGHRDVATLAQVTACPELTLQRLLHALIALGFLSQDVEEQVKLTTTGEMLRSDTAFNVHGHALWWSQHTWDLWRDLYGSVRTGLSVRERVRDQHGFEHLMEPHTADVFHRYMVEQTLLIAGHCAATSVIPGKGTVLDIGGGSGALLCAILEAHPNLLGTVIDLPHAQASALRQFEESMVSHRAQWIAGDFFIPITQLADLVILKSILHDWDDAPAAAILRNVAPAIAKHGTLLIIERILPDGTQDLDRYVQAARSDLNMLIGLTGRERGLSEYTALLSSANLSIVNVIELPDAYSIIVAKADD